MLDKRKQLNPYGHYGNLYIFFRQLSQASNDQMYQKRNVALYNYVGFEKPSDHTLLTLATHDVKACAELEKKQKYALCYVDFDWLTK